MLHIQKKGNRTTLNCDCIATVNEKLAERNMELDTVSVLGNPAREILSVSTRWKDPAQKKRGDKLIKLAADCCPFCGTSTEEGK